MKQIYIAALALFIAMSLVACKSTHQEGVKSDMMSQWVDVAANTQATTDAAKAVLTDEGLMGVTSESTMVDGTAMGKKADGTPVKVTIKKLTDTSSSVSVTVGTMGDPKIGAEIAKKIQMRVDK